MNKQLHYSISFSSLGILIYFLSACETVVDVELPFEAPKVTLNARLQADSIPKVRLTLSRHILDNDWNFSPIPNAQVTLTSGEETYFLSYNQDEEQYQLPSLRLQAEKEYTVRVNLDGHEQVEATERIPPKVPIRSFTVNGVVERNEWSRDDDVTLTFQDPEGENFYEINAYTLRTSTFPNQHGEEVTFVERYPLYLRPKNPAYERDYYVGGSILVDDKLFDGKEANIDLFTGGNFFTDFEVEHNYESMQVITEIHFELKSVTRSYYDFSTTYGLQYWNDGDPFAQPVRVYSNIKNGYGILMGSASDVYKAK